MTQEQKTIMGKRMRDTGETGIYNLCVRDLLYQSLLILISTLIIKIIDKLSFKQVA